MQGKRLGKNVGPMKKLQTEIDSDDMRPEYDFSKMKGVRGKYFHRAWAGQGVRKLSADVAKAFPDDESVNNALRLLMEVAGKQTRKPRKAA